MAIFYTCIIQLTLEPSNTLTTDLCCIDGKYYWRNLVPYNQILNKKGKGIYR